MFDPATDNSVASRRRFLGLAGIGAAALALPGCASLGGYSLADAIRRVLTLSSENAFARLLAPGGFYQNGLASLNLDEVFGARGGILETILTSGAVRSRIARELGDVAAEGAYNAAPVIADTIRIVGFENAMALITGKPTAATEYLRGNMGSRLIDVMLPEVGDAMRLIDDPLVGPAIAGLSGIDVAAIASNLTGSAENIIWQEIGVEEAAIRANPQATGDPVIIGVFGAA